MANPINKISGMATYKVGKFSAMVRAVNFGRVTYLDPSINPARPEAFPVNAFTGQRETLDQEFTPKMVVDASLSYQLVRAIGLTIGANNVFDAYQDRHLHSSNFSSGRFVYSRRVQQMGFSGRYMFARVVAKF